MTLETVRSVVGETPHMTLAQASTITRFIEANDLKDILELGFRYGVSTAYMADQLETMGRGHITAIDLVNARDENPGIETFLPHLALSHRVTRFYEPTSYTWRLMRMLEEDPTPRFDFCYLDGAHDWFVDGFAFFLVDRMLKPGGWIIFDDVNWTFDSSPSWRESERVKNMSLDERHTPQVRQIVDLLVRPHPSYGPVRLEAEWAFVQKLGDPSTPTSQSRSPGGVTSLQTRLAAVEAELKRSRRRIATMETSRSWKVTAPLRSLGKRRRASH